MLGPEIDSEVQYESIVSFRLRLRDVALTMCDFCLFSVMAIVLHGLRGDVVQITKWLGRV